MREDNLYNPAWDTLEKFLEDGDLKTFEKYKDESNFNDRYPSHSYEDEFVQ